MHAAYQVRSPSLHLGKVKCHIYDYKPAIHEILSWRYVNATYRCMLDFFGKEGFLQIKKIANKGIETFMTRLAVVINEDYTCTFYNIFETEEQKLKGKCILCDLKTVLENRTNT